jgi:Mg-chelatase subunit ChlD/uncharacterized protein involved in exopolysaccharide biosynthesis
MKPEKPKTPRQELEASLTASLLGELPADKAAALRELIAKDVELARLYERLEQAIGLVKETAAAPEELTAGQPALKLSGKKREQLLAHFKTVAPKEFERPQRREVRVRELAIAAGLVAFIGVAAWLTFNATQESFSSRSQISHGRESGRGATTIVANDGPQSTVGSMTDQLTARQAAEQALEVAQNQTVVPMLGSSSSHRYSLGVGSPSQTSFDASSGKPMANPIALPTDYSANGNDASGRFWTISSTARGFYDDISNTFKPDKEWVGVLERSNYSSSAHTSSNQFASQYAYTVPTNQLDLAEISKLAYAPRVPAIVTNSSATNTADFAYYLDLNRQGLFDSNGSWPVVASTSESVGRMQLSGVADAEEMYRRRYGGPGWADNVHSKQGNVGLTGRAVQQSGQRKPEDGAKIRGDVVSVGGETVLGPATGTPVPLARTKTQKTLDDGVDPATGLPVPAAAPAADAQVKSLAWTGAANTNEFFTPEELFSKGPAQTLTVTELAQRSKDASGSNIYLGKELAKANIKFGTWAMDMGGVTSGTKTEEESLKQNVVDGFATAEKATTPGFGFKLMGPKETLPASASFANTSQSQGEDYFNGYTSSIPLGGSFTNAIVGITSQDRDRFYTWNSALSDLNPGTGFFYMGGSSNQVYWTRSFNDGATLTAQNTHAANEFGNPGTVTVQPNSSNIYSLDVVGYNNSKDITFSDRLNKAGDGTQSYDRNTFSRNLEQLGIEGEKEPKPKLALSFTTVSNQNRGSERAAGAPAMVMSAETLRKLEGMRIEVESQLTHEERLIESLKKMPSEKLVASLPAATPDALLNSLVEQKNLSEQALVLKQRELGEASPDIAKLRDQVSDLNSKIEKQTEGIMLNLDGRVTAVRGQLNKLRDEVERAKTNDITAAQKAEPYWEAKRKLDELQQYSQLLTMKIASENIEASLPKTTMVEVMDDATPSEAKKTDVWDRIRGKGKYESQARIKVERDQSDVAFSTDPRSATHYDPYFIQNEFEAIKSERVLSNVVAGLNLQKEWSKNGRALTTDEAIALLKKKLELSLERNTSFVDIRAKSDKSQEAAELANAVAKSYQGYRQEIRRQLSLGGISALEQRLSEQEAKVRAAQKAVDELRPETAINEAKEAAGRPATNQQVDVAPVKPATPPPVPQPELQTRENAFSTFSLNVSDVAFKLAAASLEKGQMPEPGGIRSEEFINAFDYRDPEAAAGVPVAFAWERARYPYAQNRDLLRFSIKTAAQGRQAGRPLNLVLLLDNSGSMERADRVAIIREALKVLASQLQLQDKLSVITFARTAQLRVDGVPGNQAAQVAEDIGGLTPEGGTNIEEAMNLAYQTALRHYLANGINRVVLLTDGAANLGNVEPESLKQKVEANRKQGVALDCFGIGWEGFNDDLLETLSRNGDGRYGFINTPEEAATEFAGQLAGALNVAASDVKVQVEFNPARVTAYRQIGYAKHQLTKEQFRDNKVDAAEIAAQEAGNALYVIEVSPAGQGPLGTVRVRFKIPGTSDYREHEWTVPFNGNAVALEQASPAMRLAASASAFSEWLASSPYATEVTPDTLLSYLGGVPEVYGADGRPKKLEWMIRQAKSMSGGEFRNSNVETRSRPEDSKQKDANRVQLP